MASAEVVHLIRDYAPKVLALLFPWVYALWNTARKRPIIWVERVDAKVSIRTLAESPLQKLALRIVAKEELQPNTITVPSKEFTGFATSTPGNVNEVRVTFERFGRYDTLMIDHPGKLSLQVIDSNAVPVIGRPNKYGAFLDYGVVLLALLIIAGLVLQPVEDFYADNLYQQTQETSNNAIRILAISIASGLSVSGALFFMAAVLAPGRARVFFGKRSVTV